jgi:hypothetical protein
VWLVFGGGFGARCVGSCQSSSSSSRSAAPAQQRVRLY